MHITTNKKECIFCKKPVDALEGVYGCSGHYIYWKEPIDTLFPINSIILLDGNPFQIEIELGSNDEILKIEAVRCGSFLSIPLPLNFKYDRPENDLIDYLEKMFLLI